MNDPRLDEVFRVISERPEMCRESQRAAVMHGRVELGMTPFEAKLAGGACTFKVVADPRWPEGSDPLDVMWWQSVEPDASRIWMTFSDNAPLAEARRTFTVEFMRGKAVSIKRSD